MKNKLILYSTFFTIFLFCSSLFAQLESKGDTLIVGPLNSEGQPLGALNEAINGDTTSTGGRLHKVYKLRRNTQYILTEVLRNDFPLIIVADSPDASNRPPIVRCGLNSDGSNVNLWASISDHITFKNLWISGVTLTGDGPINWIGQEVNASGKTITYDGCIVEYPFTWWAIFADWGGNNVYKITDCKFMNVGNPTGTTWNGAISNGGNIDSVILRNNTFYNFGAFAANGRTFYLEIDHCSFVNSVVHPVNSHDNVIMKYTNNLFVNCHAFSDDDQEIKRHYDQEVKGLMNYAEIQWDPQALDSLYGPGGFYGKNYDPNGDGSLTEDELVWELKNNNWFYTQPIKDYWSQFPEVTPNPWMNNYNKAMFENKTGPWTWDVWSYTRDTNNVIIDSTKITNNHLPFMYFVEENTTNLDPGLININGTDALLAQNCINIRTEWAGGTVANPVKWHGIVDYLAFTWPLNFDLSYTNTTLKSAGDGFPLGDLNWFPDQKAQWLTDIEDVTQNNSLSDNYELTQNYPNPFNPTTNIQFTVPQIGNVSLKVFNVLGQEVATLLNKSMIAGLHNINFDASKLSSGLYIYKLESGSHSISKKMMLLK